MTGLRRWGRTSRLALGALLIATGITAAAAFEAWRVDPGLTGPAPDAEEQSMAAVAAADVAPISIVFSAIARDPFRSDRKRPRNRYLLPGERVAASQARNLRPAFTGITLVGTTISDDARLAVLQMPRRAPRLVRIGETFEGLELVSVERRVATLVGPDTTVVLELPGPPGGAQQRHGTPQTTGDTTGMARAVVAPREPSEQPESPKITVTPVARSPADEEQTDALGARERSQQMESREQWARRATPGKAMMP